MSRQNRADIIYMVGKRFSLLTVIARAPSRNGARWLCRCDCGVEKIVNGGHLRSGSTGSCGCDRPTAIRRANMIHGMTLTRLYKIWIGMKSRCYDPNHMHYDKYGGRGVTICDEWLHSFPAFRAWAMDNGYADDLTIDREKNHLGYSPDNCRWLTVAGQNSNKTTNRYIEFNGERLTVSQWARRIGISVPGLIYRLDSGWPLERALACD